MPTIETGTYVKRFNFWNPATWTIPALYWDTFSQEQRIHAICRQLAKVINYADYVGINTDDIAKRLKAIEDGELNDFIVTAIENWFNENQPFIVDALETLQAQTSELESILPSSEFTSENTVKDAIDAVQNDIGTQIQPIADDIVVIKADIDALEEIIPSSEFTAAYTVKDTIDALDTSVNARIDTIDNALPVSAFDSENTVKNAIDDLNQQIVNIADRNATVILIGDSYVNDNVPSTATIGNALEVLMPNWNIYNAGDAGSCFRGGGVNGRNYKAQFVYAKNNFNDFYDTDAVLIIGSRNEAGGYYSPHPPYSDLGSVVDDCLDEIQATLPDAKIYVFPGLWDWIMPNSNLQAVNNIIQESCYKHSVFCARGCWSWGTGQESTLYMGGSNIHPNTAGCALFAGYIVNAIRNDDTYCWINRYCTLGSDGGNYHLNVWTEEDNICCMGAWSQNAAGEGTNRICRLSDLPLWLRWYDRSGNLGIFMLGYGYAAASDNEMLAMLFSTNGLSIGKGTTVLPNGFIVSIQSTQSVFYTN